MIRSDIIINIIIEGGLNSKNSPIYTMDSFKLSNKNNKIIGIKIDIYLTKDNNIVLLNEEVMKKVKINKDFISKHTLDYLKKLNIGTKIKQSRIISMDELLKIYTNKYVIVNIKNNHYNNNVIVEKMLYYVKSNPNIKWLLMSDSNEILNLFYSKESSAKIGKIINGYTDTKYSFDFYSVNINNINITLNNNKNNNIVVVENVKTPKDIKKLHELENNFSDLLLITTNTNLINNRTIK